ncbi:Fic family protein [Candidatus Babeliales bacterium]|nr:Fic family protein [Candidatus Babeliales bacterium]MBP9843796.1 Fic family protein [Candidatus Babeliales bacterium]
MRKSGIYETLGDRRYFIPDGLPPANPPLNLTPEIFDLHGKALYHLGILNETTKRIPDQQRFMKSYVIKEALLTSAIEGIHTTLIDVFTTTNDESVVATKNTQLVVNYSKAVEVALSMMKDDNLPISSRIICAAHNALLSVEQGAAPGVYRKQSVTVGNLIPAPANYISNLMSDLEKYINEENSDLPVLIKAGLAHLQFETIHPFLDGNGRIGRLLIILILIDGKLLDSPVLYISYYFKKHALSYYQALDKVRTEGDFENWITFYLKAVNESALDAITRAKEIENFQLTLTALIETSPEFAQIRETSLAVVQAFFTNPVTDVTQMSKLIDKSYNTTQKIILKLVELGFVGEHEDKLYKRSKQYRFDRYLTLLEKEYA